MEQGAWPLEPKGGACTEQGGKKSDGSFYSVSVQEGHHPGTAQQAPQRARQPSVRVPALVHRGWVDRPAPWPLAWPGILPSPCHPWTPEATDATRDQEVLTKKDSINSKLTRNSKLAYLLIFKSINRIFKRKKRFFEIYRNQKNRTVEYPPLL